MIDSQLIYQLDDRIEIECVHMRDYMQFLTTARRQKKKT